MTTTCRWILSGVGSRNVSGNGTENSNSNSKVSSGSVPPTPRSEGEILQSSNLRSFTFNELRASTRNFRPDSVLGEGGFGSVFKGWVDEQTLLASKPGAGIVIAVKKLNQEGLQGHREWLVREVFLLDLQHGLRIDFLDHVGNLHTSLLNHTYLLLNSHLVHRMNL